MDVRLWTKWDPVQIREYFPLLSFWRARYPLESGKPNVRVVVGIHFSPKEPNSSKASSIEHASAEVYIAKLYKLKREGNKSINEPGYIVRCPTKQTTMSSWLLWLKEKQAFQVENVPEFLPNGRFNVCY